MPLPLPLPLPLPCLDLVLAPCPLPHPPPHSQHAQSDHRCSRPPCRQCRRPRARQRRHRRAVRAACGRGGFDSRRRTRRPRYRLAGARDDGRGGGRDCPLRRVRVRPRCSRRRNGGAGRAGARVPREGRHRPHRAAGDPVRSAQRRRQGLGSQAALLRSRRGGMRGGSRVVRTRHRRCRLWGDHGDAERRTRSLPAQSRPAASRSALSSPSMPWARR